MPRLPRSQARQRRAQHTLGPSVTEELQHLYNNWRDVERERIETSASAQRRDSMRGRWRSRGHEAEKKRAFKRKLGACLQCKEIKVTCDHWALNSLEDGSRDLLQTRDERGPRDNTRPSTEAEVEKGGPCDCELQNPGDSLRSHLHTSAKDSRASARFIQLASPTSSPPPSPKMEDNTPATTSRSDADLEKDLKEDPVKAEAAAARSFLKMEPSEKSPFDAPAHPNPQAQLFSTPTHFPAIGPPPTWFTPFPGQVFRQEPKDFMDYEPCIGIGRKNAPFDGAWECVYASGEPPTFCGVHFHTERDLIDHFSEKHHPMKRQNLEGYYVCKDCQMYNDKLAYCMQCGLVDYRRMEWWLCGHPKPENIENLNGMLPMSKSFGSMTEGRSVADEFDFEDKDMRMVVDAMDVTHQGMQFDMSNGHEPQLLSASRESRDALMATIPTGPASPLSTSFKSEDSGFYRRLAATEAEDQVPRTPALTNGPLSTPERANLASMSTLFSTPPSHAGQDQAMWQVEPMQWDDDEDFD